MPSRQRASISAAVRFKYAWITARTAPYSRWKEVATKQLDATKGMLQGKLKLKGDLPTIVRYTKASQEMTECTTRVPVEWPDEA